METAFPYLVVVGIVLLIIVSALCIRKFYIECIVEKRIPWLLGGLRARSSWAISWIITWFSGSELLGYLFGCAKAGELEVEMGTAAVAAAAEAGVIKCLC